MPDAPSFSERLFRMLLFAYPKRVRRECGRDMWLTFRSHLCDARAIGRLAVLDLWRREIVAIWRRGRQPRVSANQHDDAHRAPVGARRRNPLRGTSVLDFKLGLRMLVRYPGLTVVGGLGIAVAIAIGVGTFGFVGSFADTTLPFDHDEQIITIQAWNIERNRPEQHVMADVFTWREESKAIHDLGAAVRVPGRNLITHDGRVELVHLAMISASGFRVTRVRPLLGRTLLESDETAGAPPVLVVGYEIWRDVFASDPETIGARVRLGDVEHTVVGVMPQGFAFPFNEEVWSPLRLDPERAERGEGPALITFGRLADHVTLEGASTELATISEHGAAAHSEANRRVRPRVMPYTLPFVDLEDPQAVWLLHLLRVIMSLVLVVVCVNVAILVYARTAMRQREIGVRTALGATRSRVVVQLFVEAFVLAAGAALIGVLLADLSLRKIAAFWEASASAQKLPFWLDIHLSAGSVAYAVALTILAGAIVGVLPALKATGRDVHANLQRLASGGFRGSLGGTWTSLIVAQVAVAMAGLPVVAYQTWDFVGTWNEDPGFAADEVVTASVVLNPDSLGTDADRSRSSVALLEVIRRLEDEPSVAAATYGLFGAIARGSARIEVHGLTPPSRESASGSRQAMGRFAFYNEVDADFLTTLDIPLMAGRHFTTADQLNANTVIVNETFARVILGGDNPIGRRIRHVGQSRRAIRDSTEGRWYDVVGMVSDFGQNPNFGATPAVYHAIPASHLTHASLVLRLRGDATAHVATRLRQTAAAVDPTMQLFDIRSEGDYLRQERRAAHGLALAVSAAVLCVVLLSSAGIYALMSFTVTQRRREIGIRTALGGQPQHILMGIFTRATVQILAGVIAGVALAVVGEIGSDGLLFNGHGTTVLSIGSIVMLTIGFVAAFGPARRGLRVQPTEALQSSE